MPQAQDSSDPTGVVSTRTGAGGEVSVSRARNRKANAAVELRLAGATWGQIAETLGYPTARTARVAMEKALEKQLVTGEDREAMRNLAGMRLDRLLRGVWAKATNPSDPEHLAAVAKARDIVDRHARLFGLDAPAEFVVTTPATIEIEAWVARMLNAQGPPVVEYDIVEGAWEEDEPDALST